MVKRGLPRKSEVWVWWRLFPGLSQQAPSNQGCPHRVQCPSVAKRQRGTAQNSCYLEATSNYMSCSVFSQCGYNYNILYVYRQTTHLNRKPCIPCICYYPSNNTFTSLLSPPSSHTNSNHLSGCYNGTSKCICQQCFWKATLCKWASIWTYFNFSVSTVNSSASLALWTRKGGGGIGYIHTNKDLAIHLPDTLWKLISSCLPPLSWRYRDTFAWIT